jgi:RNA polymerase sigma-70 factor (ECF subfamily)
MAEAMADFDKFSGRKLDTPQGGSTSSTLLDLAKGKDASAWQQIEFLYTPLVRWWCQRRDVRKPQDLEDVTQEVFQAVAQEIGNFTKGPQGSFRRWLYTITRYKIADFYRRHAKGPEAVGGTDAHARMESVPAASAEAPSDEELLSERAILVRRAMELVRSKCAPRTWEAAWRVVVEGHEPSDVAADLGMTAGAVHTAKSRVLSRLREVLEQFQEETK